MRKVKQWRYYCSFCKKSGGSSGHMATHEKHCTMNPNRICRMCAMFDFDQPDLAELIASLPNPEKYCEEHTVTLEFGKSYSVISFPGLEKAVEKAMSKLREKTQNCPACIMAALRQAKIPVRAIESFSFTEECKAWWDEFNEEQRDMEPW